MKIRSPSPMRPTFANAQRKWRLFRSASTTLPLEPDPSVKPTITTLRSSEHCIVLIADTLQRNDTTISWHMGALIIFGAFMIIGVGLLQSNTDSPLPFGSAATFPIAYLLIISLSRMLSYRLRYRSSTVRVDRRARRIYFVPYPDESPDSLWILDWDELLAIDYYRGKGQGYLYLVGYTSNLTERELVKVPIIGAHIGYYNESTWTWLQRYMAGDPNLPPPTVESPPRSSRDVLLRYGGRWVLASFTDPKRRWWLPLTLWVDLVIVLLVMPVMALPQLIILTYPEPQFPPENDRLCGFADEDGDHRA